MECKGACLARAHEPLAGEHSDPGVQAAGQLWQRPRKHHLQAWIHNMFTSTLKDRVKILRR
jgi:hypothetical protein